MIPFKLFKYIYANEILYTIIYVILATPVIGILFLLNILVSKNSLHIPILVISVLCGIFVVLYVSKFVLNKVVFSEYKKIKITTNLETIDWGFFLKLFILRTVATILIELIFYGISYILNIINIKNIIDFICFITEIIVDYCIYNWYLSKHISVSLQSKSENNELV